MDTCATYDFHLHTHWSYDGFASVEYCFQRAKELSLCAIAITEHFNMDSLSEIEHLASSYAEIKIIPALEVTISGTDGVFDLVCMGIPLPLSENMKAVIHKYSNWQQEFNMALSSSIKALGYEYSTEQMFELLKTYRPSRIINKQGLTQVHRLFHREWLVKEGIIDAKENYNTFLERCESEHPLPKYPATEEILPAIRREGAILILAHPFRYFNRDDRNRMDALREEFVFDGIECAHPGVPHEFTPGYEAYCHEHNLLCSAGSDNHIDPSNMHPALADREIRDSLGGHIGKDIWCDKIIERLAGRIINE